MLCICKGYESWSKEATVYVNGRIESRLAFIGDDYVFVSRGYET